MIAKMHSFFKPYKNKHMGEVAYIFGSGPTVNQFQEQEPGIYIAGNNAHRNPSIRDKLSYIFFLYRGYQNYYNNTSTVYGDYCQMIRDLPPNVRKFCCLNFHTTMDEPTVQHIRNEVSNVDFYRVDEFPPPRKIDIETEKLWNFSIVYGMVQFAVYAGFKKIYLVGCDCTAGYFFNPVYEGEHFHRYEYYTGKWVDMKHYLQAYHPEVQVVSINPVGISGLFEDIHTTRIRTLLTPTKQIPVYDAKYRLNYLVEYPTVDLISKVTLEKGGWGLKYNVFASRFGLANSVIIDVGANIGSFTLFMAKQHPDCLVYAFEAQRIKSYQLAGNIYLNNLENVFVEQVALTDSDTKQLSFVIADKHSNGASRLQSEANQTYFTGEKIVAVPARRLDDYLYDTKPVSLIKIDVEGHEENVIRGGRETILKYKPIILFNSWDFDWAKAKQNSLMNYIQSLNYDIFPIDIHEYLACHTSHNTVQFRNLLAESIKTLH